MQSSFVNFEVLGQRSRLSKEGACTYSDGSVLSLLLEYLLYPREEEILYPS